MTKPFSSTGMQYNQPSVDANIDHCVIEKPDGMIGSHFVLHYGLQRDKRGDWVFTVRSNSTNNAAVPYDGFVGLYGFIDEVEDTLFNYVNSKHRIWSNEGAGNRIRKRILSPLENREIRKIIEHLESIPFMWDEGLFNIETLDDQQLHIGLISGIYFKSTLEKCFDSTTQTALCYPDTTLHYVSIAGYRDGERIAFDDAVREYHRNNP